MVVNMANWAEVTLLILIFLLSGNALAFGPPYPSPGRKTQLNMVFGAEKRKAADSFPRDVKEAVSRCRESVQEALQKRISRMDIEMPVGTKFGVEKTQKKRKPSPVGDVEEGGPTRDELETSDRELARLFVEMFQPLGSDHISVVFNEAHQAETAKKKWKGDASAQCRVLTLGRRGPTRRTNAKKKKTKGFATRMAEEMDEGQTSSGAFRLPDQTEVALFVAPGQKEFVVIEQVCDQVGMGTLVVLLNARLSRVEKFGTDAAKELFLEEFESVFHLGAAPQDVAPACLVHRAYPGDWKIARKPKVGQPKLIGSFASKPKNEDFQKTYASIEVDDVEQTIEGVVNNVAGWFGI